jgi:hypothetical protein
MTEREKQRPPPAPKLTEKDRAHLDWIQENGTNLVRTALKLYKKSGRGAFIIREQDAKPSGTTARYFPATNMSETGNWPDTQTLKLIHTYNPTHQFVIAFVHLNGIVNTYTIRFFQKGDTFAVEAV